MPDRVLWGIHAGRFGDAEKLFREQKCIAIGWPEMGTLGLIAADREQLKLRHVEVYPTTKAGAVPTAAGVMHRFAHEMQIGDLVAYPSKQERSILIGRVSGEYRYEPGTLPEYPNRRSVDWLHEVPRLGFSQGALYEIGSALSLFQIRTYADEYFAVVDGHAPPSDVGAVVDAGSDDDTVAAVAKDIEDTTQDFILKRLLRTQKGLPLESFVVHLLQCMGYQARLARRNEPSVDVIAHKDQLGIEPPIIKIQVKSSSEKISDKDVSALYGKLSTGEYGLVIALGGFTSPAKDFEQTKANLRLIDGDELVELILSYYEMFDSQHKGMLPLRRVYVPQAVDL